MNKAFAIHANHILHEFPVPTRSIQKGDIVSFLYEGERRLALILQPSFEKKTHALVLENLTRPAVMRISSLIFSQSPQVFYETYLSQNTVIKNSGSYRTFETRKITSPKRVLYDFGFNTANPNTILFFGGVSVVLGYDDKNVYADSYEMINNFVRDKAERGLYISTSPLPSVVLSYARELGSTLNFKSWLVGTDANQQQSHLQKLLVGGGVFFATDSEIQTFKDMLGI